MRLELYRLDRALRRLAVARNRLEVGRARSDTRDWALARRATMLGALLEIAGRLQGAGDDDPADLRARWRRAELRAFAADHEAAAAAGVTGLAGDETAEGNPA